MTRTASTAAGATLTSPPRTSRVAASPDAALRVREWVFAELRDARWPEPCLQDVALAVDEAVQNAVEHGSEPDAEIRVDLRVGDDAAEVRVRDRGRPGAAPPTGPPSAPGDHSVRGRGRLIMSNLADVVWRPAGGGGTEVRLRFRPDDDQWDGPGE
ncbi:MAG TPA: ATP-binding protein [Miltoncostaeaceae bacterium]|nr:ATP-binding protein [Miltoncostaeaceae bacterium]